ncbi:MAG: hypothetical protein LBI63_00210, partial [Candidatus Ancillula sp.]|nr:hypothetical protein [Candidatus Ancillula sp.]
MWLMNKNAYRNSELAEKNSAENSVSCKQLAQDNVHTAKSSTSANNIKSTSAQNMRNFRNFHAKITPLIAVFALVAFSILAFTKLPAFAEDHAQDLNKAEVLCGDSASSEQGARDLSKTEVSRGDSAGSGQDAQNNSVITPLNKQDSSTQSVPSNEQAQSEQDSVITPLDTQTEQNQHAQDNCVQTHSAGQDLEPNSAQTHLNTQINAQVPLRVQSTTITPKASTGVNINLSDNPETTLAGTGWTYDS